VSTDELNLDTFVSNRGSVKKINKTVCSATT